jgi:hypothetical protein
MHLTHPIEIFYPGLQEAADGRRLHFSAAEVKSWVKKAIGQRIPLVPGHPANDEPVFGYATGFSYNAANNRLTITEAEDVSPTFQKIVNSCQLNNVSVKIVPDQIGGWRLKHIGFLGKSPPALSRLRPAQFSKSPDLGVVIMPLSEEEKELEFAAREIELADREEQLAQELAFAASTAKWQPVIDGLVAEGKILPATQERWGTVMRQLDGAESLSFSQGGATVTQSPAEFVAAELKSRAPIVDYQEKSAGKPGTIDEGAAFMMKGGKDQMDDEDAEMHQSIVDSGVDPKDSAAYAAAVKKHMTKGKK